MADRYVRQQTGVADGTKVPSDKADGRQVGAKLRSISCSKNVGEVWNTGDQVFLCTLRPGESLREVLGLANASLGTTTLSIGTKASTQKYVNGQTLTAVNIPTPLGPLEVAAEAAPLTAPEDLWLTLGIGGIPGGTGFNLDLRVAAVG